MKTTKFAIYLNKYFTVHLPSTGGNTPATIDSYRYAFILLLEYMHECGVPADKVDIRHLTRKKVIEFLGWLQSSRGNSSSTRNQRQAAINSFVRYLMYEFPEHLPDFQEILAIPAKKTQSTEMTYLKTEDMKHLFSKISTNTACGIRNFAIMTILYTTGIRVSELIDIKVRDVSLGEPPTLLVHGKGQKSRYVPLTTPAIAALKRHMESHNLNRPNRLADSLFVNHMKKPFKRQGINYIVKKYFALAKSENPALPDRFSPHNVRHTTAMGLVNSGVDLIYIRDLLGHVSVTTTEVYAKADAVRKRAMIEAASSEIVPSEEASWETEKGLKEWLKGFNMSNIM